MATQFPVDAEADRFVEGQPDTAPAEDIGSLFDDTDIEELPDGGAMVTTKSEGPRENEDFYRNLADDLDLEMDEDFGGMALRYIELVEKDRRAREKRDEQYEEGIRRTGLGNDAPGGANFSGASKVVHPVMAEACIDFASRAIKELFPPDGPVRTNIIGDVDENKLAAAERKRDFMNWQLTNQIEEFRDEQEQMMTQLPLGGSQYMKLWYDEKKRRPCAEFLPIDNVLLPFAAANFYTAQRVTEVHDITQYEFDRRVASGLYKDISWMSSALDLEQTKSQKANDKIEGRNHSENEDGLRRIYHIYTWLEIKGDEYTKGESAPYILMIDDYNSEAIGLYRNWEEGDDTMAKLDWIVEFKFIPWRGAYAIGLPHLIGGLSAALTGSLRALLDSAHINNAATLLKLKGAKLSGQSVQVEVTQVAEIEAAPGIDDIKKLAMPMPFNPPSPVLFSLLSWLTDAAKGVVTTSEEKIADVQANAPVGTTQALIEQGAAVFSAIHARLHASQARVLKILGRINKWYLEDMQRDEVVEGLDINREDFFKSADVIPVSDPHIFSETQRMAQTQAVMALMEKNPDLFNRQAVVQRFLKQIKVPNITELMVNTSGPEKADAATENVAMSIGQSASAYPEQDHLGHIQVHLDYAKDPVYGGNPLIAPTFSPKVIEHLKQHIVLWYLSRMNGYVKKTTGQTVEDYGSMNDPKPMDKIFGAVSQHVMLDTKETLAGIMPIIQQIMQQSQQSKPQPDMPPDAQVLLQTSMAETQRRAQRDQQEMQLKQAELQADASLRTQKMQAEQELAEKDLELRYGSKELEMQLKEQIEAAKIERDAVGLKNDQDKIAIEMAKGGLVRDDSTGMSEGGLIQQGDGYENQ
jgi:hypothetical protein